MSSATESDVRDNPANKVQIQANKTMLREMEKERVTKLADRKANQDLAETWAEVREEMASEEELHEAMSGLEAEMKETQGELETREIELEQKYIALGKQSGMIPDEAYDARLEELERQRKRLEDARSRLQARFQQKMISLSRQLEEVQMKNGVIPMSPRGGEDGESPNSGKVGSPNDGIRVKKRAHLTDRDKAVQADREKGWVSFSQPRTTHNFHLQRRQEESERKSQTRYQKAKGDESKGQIRYGQQDEDAAWYSFRRGLRRKQEKWLKTRESHNISRLRDLQRERRKKNPDDVAPPITRPNIEEILSQNPDAIRLVQQDLRQQELIMMEAEEERRYMVMRIEGRDLLGGGPQSGEKIN